MNKGLWHSNLDKVLNSIEDLLDLIKIDPKDVSSDSKTLMQIYMTKQIFNFGQELEETVINEFKKLVGEE